MNHRTAPMSRSIRFLTAIILAMVVGFILGGIKDQKLLVGGVALAVITLACYLLAPVSFEVSEGCLTVVLRGGRISYGQIVDGTKVNGRLPFTIRLFGNSGLFAGAGIFWNKRDGLFRVYATRAKPEEAIFVQTTRYKLLLTPNDLQAFMDDITSGARARDERSPTCIP